MCGIAAFSIPEHSNVNARELAHALLTQIENRGTHASGFAWYGADGSSGYYKQPKPGSQLSLGELPRNAKTVILHTRYATQGDRMDNRNNHPVLSTDNTIALVHNGVISNDWRLREELGIDRTHGEVDSLVIPSLIQQQGVEGLSKLAGYAAVAWLDGRENGQLHIARLKSSPVAYTHLFDGTFVMASTGALLEMALLTINMPYGGVFDLDEGRMIEVVGGMITEHEASPRMSWDSYAYSRHSAATAGGHTTTRTPAATRTPHTTARTIVGSNMATETTDGNRKAPAKVSGSEDVTPPPMRVTIPDEQGDSCETTIGAYYEDLERWREKQGELDMAAAQQRSMAMGDWDYSDVDPEADPVVDNWAGIVSRLDMEEASLQFNSEGFYIVDHDGGMSHYPTLDDLEGQLRWLAKMTRTEYDLFASADDKVNWVNHIMDIGSVNTDGALESWVEDTADIDNFESPHVRNLQYLREGAGLLATLKGA